jgi:RND family efflux transporter MFP subunit
MRRVIFLLMLFAFSLQAKDIYATFTVEAKRSANLAFTSSGTVKSVYVEVSSLVKKGDILSELQNNDLKAALNIATTALKYAKKDYERQLKVKKLVDASSFDSYLFKYENAKAQVIYQQALLDKTLLKAPFDGIIFEKSIEVGDVVSSAMIRTLFKVQSVHKRKLVLEFDQKYWQDVKVGDIFKYKVDGDSKEYKGKIYKIYPYANRTTRKIKAEVEAKDLVAGLFGDGTIVTQSKEK